MGLRKGNGRPVSSDVIGMTLTRWLILVLSLIIGGVTDAVFFDAIEALAQRRPGDVAFLGLLLFLVFALSAGTVFAVLDAVIVRKKRIKW